MEEKGLLNANREINKYKLDHSTFDLIDVDKFHNTNWSTVFGYIWCWILIFLSWILLGVDIYTCLNILVFHKWSTDDYQPYAYSIAKWIFTGCIIFQFVLLFYHWLWAIHTYRTRNIALAYVNNIAKILYTVKSYNFHCLFSKIEQDTFFDWSCFLCYNELDNALQILVADAPRQVINILTLRYYATDGDLSNDIIANIKKIAELNLRLSIILSFMCLSVAIFAIFFFKFVLGMLFYLPVVYKLRGKGFKSLKRYCCKIVNDKVRYLVLKNHKPKDELLERGILNINEIKENPLLNDEITTLDNDFEYKALFHNDNQKLFNHSYNLKDLSESRDPFRDSQEQLGGSMIGHNPFEAHQREGLSRPPKSFAPLSRPNNPYKHSFGSINSVQNPFDTQLHLPLMLGQDRSSDEFPPRSDSLDFVSRTPVNHSQETFADQWNQSYREQEPIQPERALRNTSIPDGGFNQPKQGRKKPSSLMNLENPSASSLNEAPYPVRGVSVFKKDRSQTEPIRPIGQPVSPSSESESPISPRRSPEYPLSPKKIIESPQKDMTYPLSPGRISVSSKKEPSYPVSPSRDTDFDFSPQADPEYPISPLKYPVSPKKDPEYPVSPKGSITVDSPYPVDENLSDSDSDNHRGYPLRDISN